MVDVPLTNNGETVKVESDGTSSSSDDEDSSSSSSDEEVKDVMQFEETSTASSSKNTPAVRQSIKKPSWDDVETSIDRQFQPQVRNHIRFRYCNKCR